MKRSGGSRRALLPFVIAMLAAGGIAAIVGRDELADLAWGAAVAVVAVELLLVTLARLREGRTAVDVVALLALVGALGLGEVLAGAIIALMVASGDALEQYAHRRARRELAALLSLAPKIAHRRTESGYDDVPVDGVEVGDLLLVKPGEVVPVDGAAIDAAVVDESILTGESRPVDRTPGDQVRSGSINAGGAFGVRAGAAAADSAYASIVELVRSAGVDRAPFVRLADRYALVFIPVVVGTAAAAWLWSGEVDQALAVLVVATPCPLVLAAPVAIVSGISAAARQGVVVKHGAAVEAMADTRTVLFDKTGTLTGGRARLVAVITAPDGDPNEVLRLAASVEQVSPRVLADALVREAFARGLALSEPPSTSLSARSGTCATPAPTQSPSASRTRGSPRLLSWSVQHRPSHNRTGRDCDPRLRAVHARRHGRLARHRRTRPHPDRQHGPHPHPRRHRRLQRHLTRTTTSLCRRTCHSVGDALAAGSRNAQRDAPMWCPPLGGC